MFREISEALPSISFSDLGWGKAAFFYHSRNAQKIVDNLLSDTASATNKASIVDYMLAQIDSGKSMGEMIEWAITSLDGIDHSDPVWGNAAMLFDNRIEVSRYYSVDKAINETEFPILIQILESVTIDPATVSLAKLVIDSQQESVKSLADLNGSNGFRLGGDLLGESFVTPAPPTPTNCRSPIAYPPAQPSTKSPPDSQLKTLQQLPQPVRRNRRRQFQYMIGTMLANPIAKCLGIQTMFPAISRLRHSAGLPCFNMNSSRF
ncbi:MAG: hypothetical protein IPJ05_12790 [Nitrosomonas sp.]|nr:hypothetical protein [Nitrosomonas sp.]